MSVLKIMKALLNGNIESNPGPRMYNLFKIVTGSFHQGHPKFGETAGIQ